MPKKIYLLFLLSLMLFSCRADNESQSRIYVKGKITTSAHDKVEVSIIANERIIAKTLLEGNGNFVLSGPISQNNGFALVVNSRIKSFSSTTSNLTLSADALQIIAPKSVTYLKFNEIILEK